MSEIDVVFIEGARTAFGRMGGTIRDIPASKLAAIGIRGLADRTGIRERAQVDCVFLGSAAHCSQALNPARWAALEAGLGWETSASYVEMQCGSAIDAINHAAWKIKAGAAQIVIAGGMESYSQIPAKFSMSLPPYQLIPPAPLQQTLSPVAEEQMGMGLTAENLQVLYGIPREAADEFACSSQMRAKAAWDAGRFEGEIVPVVIPATRRTPEIVFDRDEHMRPDTTLEALARLPPAFKKNGTVTAGNASGRNDGAAFVLMMSAGKARELDKGPAGGFPAPAGRQDRTHPHGSKSGSLPGPRPGGGGRQEALAVLQGPDPHPAGDRVFPGGRSAAAPAERGGGPRRRRPGRPGAEPVRRGAGDGPVSHR